MKNKFENVRNEHIQSKYKDMNLIFYLKQPKNLYKEFDLLDLYQILKTLENQELINTVIKEEIGCHSVSVIYFLK